MRNVGQRFWGALAALVVALSAPAALAQSPADRAEARRLFDEGQEAIDRKDWKTAVDRFKRGYALFPAPTLRLGQARAEAGQGHLLAAESIYAQMVKDGLPADATPAFREALQDAEKELGAVRARIPSVVIVLTATGPAVSADVTLDGELVPRESLGSRRTLDPGPHTVRARAPGRIPAEVTFTAREQGTETVRLELRAVVAGQVEVAPVERPAPPSPALRRAAIASFGFGAGGVVFGATFGGLSLARRSSLSSACPSGICPSSREGAVAGYDRLSALSVAGFVAGGLGFAQGTALYLAAPAEPAGARGVLGPLALGLGVSGLAAGAASGFVALSTRSELSSSCPDGKCPSREADRINDLHAFGATAIASLSAGAALTAAGAVLLATSPKPEGPAAGLRVTPFVTGSGGGVRGEF